MYYGEFRHEPAVVMISLLEIVKTIFVDYGKGHITSRKGGTRVNKMLHLI